MRSSELHFYSSLRFFLLCDGLSRQPFPSPLGKAFLLLLRARVGACLSYIMQGAAEQATF